ncbi:MAG: ImmA/IrrE family metallo-endopeptidase, partial [Flammeovirgaceae bacterium]
MVKAVSDAHELPRFPVDVAAIAREYSRMVFPSEPITLVEGRPFAPRFEGALIRKPGTAEWGIFYNSAISSPGRKNFTLAHELGHYLLHREKSPDDIICDRADMLNWESKYRIMESEANQFASFLLMPRDDFDLQTRNFIQPEV